MGGVVVDKLLFRFSFRSGDTGDRSRKLSEIAQNFGRFLAILIFFFGGGRAFQKLYPVYHCCLAARRLKKVHEDTPTSPEVIKPNTLSFRPNFKFLRLKLFWGDPRLLGVCASKSWSISSACKGRNEVMAQHLLRDEI